MTEPLTSDQLQLLRYREGLLKPTGFRNATFGAAIVSGLVLLATFVCQAVNDIINGASNANPALYRATLLIAAALFTASAFSVYADQEWFDFMTAIIFGIAAIVFDIILVFLEVERWIDCSTLPTVNDYICTNFPSWVYAMPVIAIIELVVNAAMIVLVLLWYHYYKQFVAIEERIGLPPQVSLSAQATPEERSVALAEVEKEEEEDNPLYKTTRSEARMQAQHNWVDTTLAVIAIIELVVLVPVAFIALAYSDRAAFYRGAYLLMPALSAGAEFAFLFVVRTAWRWFYLVLAVIALISEIIGLVYEWPRYQSCFFGTATAANIIDNNICEDDGWLAGVIPVSLLILAILTVLAIIFIIVRLVFGSSRYRKWEAQRAALDEQRRAALAQGAAAPISMPVSSKTLRDFFYTTTPAAGAAGKKTQKRR